MRDYDNYYGPKKINIIENPTAGATVTSGTVFIGVSTKFIIKTWGLLQTMRFFYIRRYPSFNGR